MIKKLFTSESVTEGHPDKVCDKIADAILDDILSKDKYARVACEVCATTGLVMVMGEISSSCSCDFTSVVRETVRDIGYNDSALGFDGNTCAVIVAIDKQSDDIAMGVDSAAEADSGDIADRIGAGDQGMMFGYATNETEQLMPLPIVLAHALTRRLTEVRKQGVLKYLRPDGKAQVTVEYTDGKPTAIDTVVVSAQHDDGIDAATIFDDIKREVVFKALPGELLSPDTKIYINPTGRFVKGGPQGDSGLTGRKIIVDTYGGYCAHGGGALSGKDPTKVDRSALYMARYVAKNLVAAKIADKCEIEVAYAIGRAKPVSLSVNTYGTGTIADDKIVEVINKVFDMRPYSIIENLGLRKPIYKNTSNYGHFGREEFPWEKTDKINQILKAVKELN